MSNCQPHVRPLAQARENGSEMITRCALGVWIATVGLRVKGEHRALSRNPRMDEVQGRRF
jgi:hypothetical protein